ncbi:MAG: peptidase M50 [Methanomicrobiales archaeon]|nr:peptidase M50 [Methanomicrobiales archaeon]
MLDRIPPRERRDLVVAWLAISVAFALIFRSLWGNAVDALLVFIISFLTAGIGFVLHEMAHKFTAIGYGYWAEFRMNAQMLLVAMLLAALVGFVFAAPGVTEIYGSYITRERNGRISLSGPLTNLVLCIPFALIYVIAGGGWPALLGLVGLRVNAMLAFFNMLPVGILDGSKVLEWNKLVFSAVFLLSLGVLIWSVL